MVTFVEGAVIGSVSLSEALQVAGWSPRQLATGVNTWLSRHDRAKLRIDPSTPYAWMPPRSYLPRAPLPDVVATVLSDQLGHRVTVSQLWPGRTADDLGTQTAADHLDAVKSLEDLTGALGDLVVGRTAFQREISAVAGPDLTAAVLDRLRITVQVARQRAEHERVLVPQVDLIAAHVAALRRLDDRHGGGALSIRYVTSELRSVLELVDYANYERDVGQKLMSIVVDLSQLLGWLHFDSSRYGPAQRYLLLSMRISQALDMPARAANAVGMLAYVCAFAGHGVDAVRIAEAAARHCPPGDPILQARIKGREATAAAAAGDLSGFRAASDGARELLSRHQTVRAAPFLYYMEPAQLVAEAGQGLVVLAEQATTYRNRLLNEAIDLLEPISQAGQRPNYPRSALVHTTFLAKAHLLRGNLDQTVDALRNALTRLADVQSPRGLNYLREMRPALVRRKRSRPVAEFLDEFDEALSKA